MRISDWSSDVCSSDLRLRHLALGLRRGLQLRLARQQRAKTIPLAVQCGGSGDKVVALQRDTCAQHGEIAQLIAQAGRLGLEGRNRDLQQQDRKSVGEGKRVSVRVDIGGRRLIKKKKKTNKT